MPLASQGTAENFTNAQRAMNEALREWYYSGDDDGAAQLRSAWEEFEQLSRQVDAETEVKDRRLGKADPFRGLPESPPVFKDGTAMVVYKIGATETLKKQVADLDSRVAKLEAAQTNSSLSYHLTDQQRKILAAESERLATPSYPGSQFAKLETARQAPVSEVLPLEPTPEWNAMGAADQWFAYREAAQWMAVAREWEEALAKAKQEIATLTEELSEIRVYRSRKLADDQKQRHDKIRAEEAEGRRIPTYGGNTPWELLARPELQATLGSVAMPRWQRDKQCFVDALKRAADEAAGLQQNGAVS